jgi:hypothetical protein
MNLKIIKHESQVSIITTNDGKTEAAAMSFLDQ